METADLEQELEALREALQESEEVCRAIKSGEVDAVVAGPEDEHKRVLLMSDAYARYRQLVEDMQQGAVTLSESGEILFANHSFARMAGETLLDLFRTRLHDRIAGADLAALDALLAAHAGQPDIEVSLMRRDRTLLPVRLSLVSASDDFVTLLITEHDEREDAKATLEAIHNGEVDAFVVGGEQVVMLDDGQMPYRLLVERMRQGATTVSREGEILYANERFASMVGARPNRLLGHPLADLVFHLDRPAFARMLANKGDGQIEVRLRSSTGHLPVVLASASVLEDKRLVLFMDITQQKRHAASDERTRKFLGTLAHEFRNILGPIVNSVAMLKRSELDGDAQKAAGTIERQAERLLALVEDLRRINPD